MPQLQGYVPIYPGISPKIPSSPLTVTSQPHDFRRFYRQSELGLALLLQGEWDAALSHANTAIALRPGYWHAHVVRINALWRSGDDRGAAAAMADLLAARPSFVPGHVNWIPFSNPAWNGWLLEPLLALQSE